MVSCNRITIKNQKQMFTVEQIKMAHNKVKSGADFPAYIKEIKELGVTHYEAYVTDGHINYHGTNNYTATVPAKYEPLEIISAPKKEEFKAELLDEIKKLFDIKRSEKKSWLRSTEVKELLKISSATLQKLRVNGTLSYTRIGGTLYYNYKDIEQLLDCKP